VDGEVEQDEPRTADGGDELVDTADELADDDVVVLSWWQHPVNVIGLIIATALIAGMVTWLIIDANDGQQGSAVDVGFLQDMRIHHEQAVDMAFTYLERPDTDPALETVARTILFGQSFDIGRMVQLLRDMEAPEAAETDEAMAWMGMPTTHAAMPGMATEPQLAELGAASGAAADQLFVDLMVAHHQGGLHMSEYAAAEADNSQVRRLAQGMVDGQRGDIAELQSLGDDV
jgi:uncharacterized protein (DUF305 family)